MTTINEILLLTLSGVLTVTAIDSLGSVTSRKWNYNYAYLSPISFLTYTFLGYFGHKFFGELTWAILVPAIVGIYDGTVGWKISTVLKANFGKYKEYNGKLSLSDRVFGMIGISVLFAFMGFCLA